MGIIRFKQFIEKHAPGCITHKVITDYTGKLLAIDIIQILCRYCIAIRGKGYDLKRTDGKITSHLHAIFYFCRSLLLNGVKIIAVFDGKPPVIKETTLRQRKDRRRKAQEKLTEMIKKSKKTKEKDKNLKEQIKHFKRTFSVTKKMAEESQKLLTLLGIPIVQSPFEADSQSSAIARYKEYIGENYKAYGVVSEDWDHLPFGSPILLKNFSNRKSIEEISLKVLLKELDLNQWEFIDLCILIGTEYCPTIKNLGPDTAFKLYKEFRNMDKFVAHLRVLNKKYKKTHGKILYEIPDNFLDAWKQAKTYYIKARVINPETLSYDWKPPKVDALKKFLIKDNEFDKNTETHIHELDNIYKDAFQRGGLGKVFPPSFFSNSKRYNRIRTRKMKLEFELNRKN